MLYKIRDCFYFVCWGHLFQFYGGAGGRACMRGASVLQVILFSLPEITLFDSLAVLATTGFAAFGGFLGFLGVTFSYSGLVHWKSVYVFTWM